MIYRGQPVVRMVVNEQEKNTFYQIATAEAREEPSKLILPSGQPTKKCQLIAVAFDIETALWVGNLAALKQEIFQIYSILAAPGQASKNKRLKRIEKHVAALIRFAAQTQDLACQHKPPFPEAQVFAPVSGPDGVVEAGVGQPTAEPAQEAKPHLSIVKP